MEQKEETAHQWQEMFVAYMQSEFIDEYQEEWVTPWIYSMKTTLLGNEIPKALGRFFAEDTLGFPMEDCSLIKLRIENLLITCEIKATSPDMYEREMLLHVIHPELMDDFSEGVGCDGIRFVDKENVRRMAFDSSVVSEQGYMCKDLDSGQRFERIIYDDLPHYIYWIPEKAEQEGMAQNTLILFYDESGEFVGWEATGFCAIEELLDNVVSWIHTAIWPTNTEW